MGTMEMMKQKVPAAELTAMMWALKLTRGEVTISYGRIASMWQK